MSLDPHAVAKIEARVLLEHVERLVSKICATNAGVSTAEAATIARLKQRLEWCDECSSRRRSKVLLLWILKQVGELLFRVIETSSCKLAGLMPARNTYDAWTSHQTIESCWRMVAKGLRPAA